MDIRLDYRSEIYLNRSLREHQDDPLRVSVDLIFSCGGRHPRRHVYNDSRKSTFPSAYERLHQPSPVGRQQSASALLMGTTIVVDEVSIVYRIIILKKVI